MKRRRANTIPPSPRFAPFPRAATTFVGRQAELARVARLVEHESLFLVYGVGGIGKSELVYKAIDAARARPEFAGVTPVLVQVAAGTTGEQLTSLLSMRLGAFASVASPMPDAGRLVEDDLAAIARALEEAPTLLFLDDLHLCEPRAASRLLTYLGRHVRQSRVFVASRTELLLPAGLPPPVVVRLGALDAAAAGELAQAVALRLGVGPERAAAAQRQGAGSPFYVQRALVAAASRGSGTPTADGSDDPLESSLVALTPAERAALLRAALLRGRITPEELARIADGGEATLGGLARRFLIDVERETVMVHDLVHDAVLPRAAPAELAAARRAAAEVLALRFNEHPRSAVLDGVDAAQLLVDAGDARAAWQLLAHAVHSIAGAGLDHLLLPTLATLRERLPEERLAIDVLTARVLVRRSHIDQADHVLRRAGREAGAEVAVRYLLMSGLVAQHMGELDRAEDFFRRAHAAATLSVERFRALLSLAVVAAWRGDGPGCRARTAEARAEDPAMGPREQARLAWAEMLAAVLEFDFGVAATTGRRTLASLGQTEAGGSADDLRLMVGMLTTLGRAESDDVVGARAMYEELVAPAAQAGTLREHLAALFHAIVLNAEGHLREARTALGATFAELVHHRDHLHACLAGHYLGAALLALGDVTGALDVLARTTEAAAALGLASLAPHGRAAHAQALAAAGRATAARDQAAAVLDDPRARPATLRLARSVLAALDSRAPRDRAEAAAIVPPDAERRGAGDAERQGDAEVEAALPASERAAQDLDDAECALMRREFAAAQASAERARRHYAAVGRAWLEARALCVLAACPSLEAPLLALEARAHARQLATENGYAPLLRFLELLPAAGDGGGTVEPALSRRARARRELDLVVEMDAGRIVAAQGARAIKGRPMACALLARLVAANGEVVSAETLYCDVWGGREYHPLRHRNTVYVGVNRLRSTLRELLPDWPGMSGMAGAAAGLADGLGELNGELHRALADGSRDGGGPSESGGGGPSESGGGGPSESGGGGRGSGGGVVHDVIETVPTGWRLAEGLRACVFSGDEVDEMK